MLRNFERYLITSDFHTGHQLGLTPPGYKRNFPKGPGQKIARQNKLYSEWFYINMEKYKPYDVAIVNGDAIDGSGILSGGVEQITTDRTVQVEMAVKIINSFEADQVYMTFGTPYHGGKEEDWEKLIATEVGAEIEDEMDIDANGLIINIKHHSGRSNIPWGRPGRIAKDWYDNLLASIAGRNERANIVIRSHVHYFTEVGAAYPTRWKAYTTPALMGYGPKYARKLSGGVDFGFLIIDVQKGGDEWAVKSVLMPLDNASLKTPLYSPKIAKKSSSPTKRSTRSSVKSKRRVGKQR